MARIVRTPNLTLEEEAMPGSTVEARQAAKRREVSAASIQPTAKELKAMPASVQKQAISRLTERSAKRLDELLSKAEAQAKAIETGQVELKAAVAERQAVAKQAAAEAETALAEGDKTIIKAVEGGIIPYQGLPPVFQQTINQTPQYKTAQSAGLTAAVGVLTAVGVEGLMDIMDQIRTLYPDISSEDALMLLKFDKRFNAPYLKRFAGNKMLMDAGFAPLDDKEYLATERAFDKIFSAYELKQFNNKERFASLIGNRISADELAGRVSLAVDRVNRAARETRDAIKELYPELTNADLVAYMIDPVNQLPTLQRKVQAAEIGGAALAQNLTIGLKAAPEVETGYTNVRRKGLGVEELVSQGVTLEEARKGYQAVAEVLPTAEKLSAIYGARMDQYARQQAEEEQFKGLASAKRARQKLTEAEIAAFSGETGLGRTSLEQKRFV